MNKKTKTGLAWNDKASAIKSKGSTAKKAASLADLHRRRSETDAQYFTSEWVAEGIWSVLGPNLSADQFYSVIDTSIGSGRLLADAPTQCALYGIDIDERCIEALTRDADQADRTYRFEVGGIEGLTISGFSLAVINPPFSITLGSPFMEPYDCTSHGKFGPHTSALSHEYALEQALEAAGVVAALLPSSMIETCRANRRLAAIYQLPGDAFKSEAAKVNTCVFVFADQPITGQIIECAVSEGDDWPALSLDVTPKHNCKMRLGNLSEGEPTITREVTGDHTVRVEHHNRRVILKFECGLVEAKVRNAILVGDVEPGDRHRYPKNIEHIGSARLWMDTWLLQNDPDAAFNQVLQTIRDNSGVPVVSKNVSGYWAKLKKKHALAKAPFRRWVKQSGAKKVRLKATRASLLIPGDYSSPAIKKGEIIEVEPLGGDYRVIKNDVEITVRRDDLIKRFEFLDEDERASADWQLLEPGLAHHFPTLAEAVEARMKKAGIDWLWPYQKQSAIELVMKKTGSIAGWIQGTGKARMSIALALLGGRHSLIAVESGLIKEMIKELKEKVQLDSSFWGVITSKDEPESIELKQVTLISYNTLKRKVRGKKTMAQFLRRRFHTVIADEGGLLSNIGSQQSRAVLALAAQKLVVSDGTPISNYPRNIYPIAASTAGQAVAHQPYGMWNHAYLEPRLMLSASYAERGVDHFRDRHIVTEWITNQFAESNSGAARELPQIARVVEFRDWLKGVVQRRVRYEPEVAKYASCPEPIFKTEEVKWDRGHLAHYLDVSMNFAHWYTNHVRAAKLDGKGANLVVVLAKIAAVVKAANHPHVGSDFGSYGPLTSKQRVAIEKLVECDRKGTKVILYAYSPKVIDRLNRELTSLGVKSVVFHGQRGIAQRTKALDDEFRFGSTNILLSSWVGQKGLNLPQGKHILFYNRSWSGSTEDQAICRTQRPDQDQRVLVEYLHLAGSIDEYMGQIVEWKLAAADSGLDWGDGATESDTFMHMDSIIEQFCRDAMDMSAREAQELLVA